MVKNKMVIPAIAFILIGALTACANTDDHLNGPRKVSTGDLEKPMELNDNAQNPNPAGVNSQNIYWEIQPINGGFITMDPNSYSTAIPSQQYPHTRTVNNGQFWHYVPQPAGGVKQPLHSSVQPK